MVRTSIATLNELTKASVDPFSTCFWEGDMVVLVTSRLDDPVVLERECLWNNENVMAIAALYI